MIQNPHPDAGAVPQYETVGPYWVCIPCLFKSRHEWSVRALKAELELQRTKDIDKYVEWVQQQNVL